FAIDKDYAEKLRTKISVFKTASKTRKAVFLTMITTYGIEKNKHAAGLVQNEVVLDDLFG
ncbi:MAG: ATPase, partial [Saprospiraceae bacterium]